MATRQSPRISCINWLDEGPLAPHGQAYKQYLIDRACAASTFGNCLGGVAHFVQWLGQRRIRVRRIDETVVGEFLDEHLPRCSCAEPVQRDRRNCSAALGHLLVVLRAQGAIAAPASSATLVDEELRRYDEHMNHVHGLAPKTRSGALRIAGRLLLQRFGGGAVDISAIKADHVRRFFAQQAELYSKPASAAAVVAALRSYFRYRTTCGDQVGGLTAVITNPVHWKLSSLPRALKPDEADRLLQFFMTVRRSPKLGYAIARCALDMGLRAGEIARLMIGDVDWQAGTVTLRGTKSLRQDILPLPMETGQALADYLQHERPRSSNPAIFVRCLGGRDQPITSMAIQKLIKRAGRRIGLINFSAHALRHTLACRLVENGSSLKEVADVLRHRSLETTRIYAKLDTPKLSTVPLPWPGSGS